MDIIYQKILNNKYKIVIFFLVLLFVSFYLSTKVQINYDLAEYLPEEMASKKAYSKYETLFKDNIPNSRFVAKDVSISEALKLKKEMEEVKGVNRVLWLDDFVDVLEPLELSDQETLDRYYRNKDACFSVTILEENKLEAVNELKKIVGKDGLSGGTMVFTVMADTIMDDEIKDIFILVIPIALLILLLTSTSWFEPLLFIATTLIAISINLGSNIIFGEISFVTATAAAILQLAVSMDYSIFLLHKFSFHKKEGIAPKDAMIMAMRESALTIKASVMTTVIGFLALIFMKFRVGADMGIVMAKGILISYITTIVLLPILIMIFHKLIEKTSHRDLIPTSKYLVNFVVRMKVPLFVLTLLVILPAFLGQASNDFIYGASNIFSKGTAVYEENRQIEEEFGKDNYIVALVPVDSVKEKELVEDLKEVDSIKNVISYSQSVGSYIPREFVPEAAKKQLVSGGYTQVISVIESGEETDVAFETYEKILEISTNYYGEDAMFIGSTPIIYDMKTVTQNDMLRVNLIAAIAIFLVLLITMKSLSLPFILVFLIEISIWINLSVPYFQDLKLSYIGYLIIGAIQLGATVDYAILMANTYIAERKIVSRLDALTSSIKKSTITIITSATIFATGGTVLGIVSSNAVILDLGKLIARGAIISALMVIFVLPGILYLFDKFIKKTTLGFSVERRVE